MTAWTPDEKARAVEVYVESGNLAEGARAVTREDGKTPAKGSVRNWAQAAGHDTTAISERSAEKTKRATEVAAEVWQERRAHLVDDAGLIAEVALLQTAFFLDAGNPRNAKDAATTFGILVDKAQVLSGDATSIVRFPWKAEEVIAEAEPRADNIRPIRSA